MRQGSYVLERFSRRLADVAKVGGKALIGAGAFRHAQLKHDPGHRLRGDIVQLASDARALLVLGTDHFHRQAPDAITLLHEIVEDLVERTTRSCDITIGERGK